MTELVCRTPWSDACTHRKRHHHPYTVEGEGYRQCHCGSRVWSVALGGGLPPLISCERCARPNRTATAYEKGRAAGPRVTTNASKPTF
jgi:hypothetical protein